MIVAEAALVLAPVTLVAAMGFAWSARRLVVAVAQRDWEDPTTWLALVIAAGLAAALGGAWFALRGNGWIFAVGLPALLPFAHLWRLR